MVAKKTTAKKSATKKTVAKKPLKRVVHKSTAAKRTQKMQSFRVYKEAPPFVTFRITRQTIYWVILIAFVIVTQLWLLKIQMDIADLTNSLLVE